MRMISGNPVLDQAVDQVAPLTDEIGSKLVGHTALSMVVLAAYFIHAYEHALLANGMQMPRDDVIKFVADAANNITTIPLPAEKRN